jgi:hypothetical protein
LLKALADGVDSRLRAAKAHLFHCNKPDSRERDSLIVGEKGGFLLVPRSVEIFNRLRKVEMRLRLCFSRVESGDFGCFKMSKMPIGDSWKTTGFALRYLEDLIDDRPFQNAFAFESGREDANAKPTLFNDRAGGFSRALQMIVNFFTRAAKDRRVAPRILPVEAGAASLEL